MMEDYKQIRIIGKIDDYLLRFWKIDVPAGEKDVDKDFYLELLRFIHLRENDRLREFTMYDRINTGFEFWQYDKYKELYTKDIVNVDGLPWPKLFNLFPMANIKDQHDLDVYNEWRMTVFKDQVRCMKNYNWNCKGSTPDIRIKNSWLHIDPDRDIHPLVAQPLEVPAHVINYVHRVRRKRAQEYGIK